MKQLRLLDEIGTLEGRAPSTRFLWTQAGDQPELEAFFSLNTVYPAAIAVLPQKNSYVFMRGAFNKKAIQSFIGSLSKETRYLIPMKEQPPIISVEAWKSEL
jgi:hypothetical protein